MSKKAVSRAMALIIIVGYVVAFFIGPMSLPKTSIFTTCDWITSVCILAYVLNFFIFWGRMFYSWGVDEFDNKRVKRMWFWIILIGGFFYLIGPLAYYIAVIEKGKGLRLKGNNHHSPA